MSILPVTAALSRRGLVWWVNVGSAIKAPFHKIIVSDSNVPEDWEPISLAVDIIPMRNKDLEHFAH